MQTHRIGARAEYKLQENQRVRESVSLAERFQHLKSLTVELAYHGSETGLKSSQIRYTVNLDNAKSVFRFTCPNQECVGGDFDLTAELAAAVREKRAAVAGELICQGWRSRTTINTVRCQNVLRYKFTLGY
jgi:hypothetical protein